MKKIIIGLLIIAILGLGAFFVLKSPDWHTYENARYRFSVKYPGRWILGEAPVNNDGREFISPDKKISCHAYGFQNALINDQGHPQTLGEFVNWLIGSLDVEEVLERNSITMAGREAQELVTSSNGIIARAVYALGEDTGRGIVCYYPSKKIMEEQNENFEAMKQSFTIDASLDSINMNECISLLNGALIPFKDFQTFRDTKYTEVTITSREAWDKDRLPQQVIDFENEGYICYPMPSEFDYGEPDGVIVAEPAVKEVEWTCELEYDDWKYLEGNDNAGKRAAEEAGFTCKKENCFTDGAAIDEASVWLCVIDSGINMEEAVQIVTAYMGYTLGTIPDASIDYDKARELLTPELMTEFRNATFVPTSYCIQDGPDDVRIFSSEYNKEMNWVEVVVEGKYGEWIQMWQFKIVPIEGDDWLIYEINCL